MNYHQDFLGDEEREIEMGKVRVRERERESEREVFPEKKRKEN